MTPRSAHHATARMAALTLLPVRLLSTRDFHSPDVQKESDADLAAVIAKGKNKMPAYDKQLKPADIQTLVAYVRDLGKK